MSCLLACLLVAAYGAGGVKVAVSSVPPLPRPNLLVNGDFEAGRDGQPDSWRWATAMPENFRVGWVREGRNGSRCIKVHAFSGAMSGYWSQVVDVQPQQTYVLHGWYRLAGGKILIYAHTRTKRHNLDARFYAGLGLDASLVPVFVRPEYVVGGAPDMWSPFRLEFTVPEGIKKVAISLGMYFAPGTAWFDDVVLTEGRVTLRVDVQADEPLAKVELINAAADKPMAIWATEQFEDGGRRLGTEIPNLPADGIYLVRAVTKSGRVVEKTYPAR